MADLLVEISDRNAARRPRLNVLKAADALEELTAGGDYRDQGTSWLARYHILQRYGAYVALMRFTDVFDKAGNFDQPRLKALRAQRARAAEEARLQQRREYAQREAEEALKSAGEAASETVSGCGCGAVGAPMGWPMLAALLLWRRARAVKARR